MPKEMSTWMNEAFETADKDEDGMLDQAEARALGLADATFTAVDQGATGELTLAEVLAFGESTVSNFNKYGGTMSWSDMGSSIISQDDFLWADVDGTGTLDLAEYVIFLSSFQEYIFVGKGGKHAKKDGKGAKKDGKHTKHVHSSSKSKKSKKSKKGKKGSDIAFRKLKQARVAKASVEVGAGIATVVMIASVAFVAIQTLRPRVLAHESSQALLQEVQSHYTPTFAVAPEAVAMQA